MIKRFNKLLLIFGVFLFGIVGCSNSIDSGSINATYIGTFFQGDEVEGEFDIINNYGELVTLLKDDIPIKYNDSFFETKTLLIFKIIESSQGNKSEIESYIIDDKTITIHVKTKQYGDVCAEGHWWFILELTKDEIEMFDSVKIYKNGEEIIKDIVIKIDLLTDEVNDYIKQIYVNKINSESQTTITMKNINILYYFGKYGDSYVSIIEGDYMAIPEKRIKIGDLYFEYALEVISVYNSGEYYNLKKAYELGLINDEDLRYIHILYERYKMSIFKK